MKRAQIILIVMLGLALMLTACGGSSKNLKVAMTDFKYEPMESTILAGEEITFSIKNEGVVLHEYVIMNLGQTAGDKFGDEDESNIFWEVEIEPGQSKTVTFTAPAEAGAYEIVCGTQGHLEAGMKGTLTVVNK